MDTDTFRSYENKIEDISVIETEESTNGIIISCENGEIVGIIHNDIELEGNKIIEDGTYIITVKLNDERKYKIKTIQINTEILDTEIITKNVDEEGNETNTEIFDGDIFDKELSIYCNKGTIESITYEGINFEGTKLTADGTYVITVKPDNGSVRYSITVIIDTIIPTLQIDGKTIIGKGSKQILNTKVTLKDGKGKGKFEKALLYKCNSQYKKTQTAEEATDITTDLKSEGYTLIELGIFIIELVDKDGNELEYTGRLPFKVRESEA